MMTDDDDDDGGEEMDIEISPKITTYLDAIKSLEDVQLFLDKQGQVAEANNLGLTIDGVTKAHCVKLLSARQSTIDEFFTHDQ